MGGAFRRLSPRVRAPVRDAAPDRSGGDDGPSPASPDGGGSEPAARVEAIVADLVMRESPASQAIYRRLSREPRDLVVGALSAAAQRQTEWNRYARVVNMLGKLDDPEALGVLRNEIGRKSTFAIHAVRAIGRMTVEGAEDALWDVVKSGRAAHRRAAAESLARRRVGRVVGPLCRLARRRGSRTPDQSLVRALRSMGRPHDLFVYLLTDTKMDTPARVEAMEDLEALQRHLNWRRLNVMNLLEGFAQNPRCPWREAAEQAADLYYARRTLLRPSERSPSDTLVRPASGPDRTPAERLVRPVSEAVTADPSETERPGFLQSVLRKLRDALDGD